MIEFLLHLLKFAYQGVSLFYCYFEYHRAFTWPIPFSGGSHYNIQDDVIARNAQRTLMTPMGMESVYYIVNSILHWSGRFSSNVRFNTRLISNKFERKVSYQDK